MPNTTLTINGIHCSGCASLIKDVSADFPAITNVEVDVDSKRVTLEHDDSLDLDAWKQEVQAANPSYTFA